MSSRTSSGHKTKSMEEELRRMKEEFKKRVGETNAKQTQEERDEETRLIVTVAVKAGLLCLGGVSLCFSSLFIPGVVPFLGGLLCGVSLIEPPPVPGASKRLKDDDSSNATLRSSSSSSDPSGVFKQILMNFIDHIF